MSSDHISGGGASKTKTKTKTKHNNWSSNHNRSKPMVVSRPERSVPLVSPSNSFASEDDHHMLKISLSSISKVEVRNLKRKLNAELDEVRILIKRLDPPQGGSVAKTGVPPGRNKKVKTGNGGGGKKGGGPGPGAADKGMVQVFKNCNTLLTKLMKHKCGWVFNVPVDAKGLGLHDYHTIVEQPMDLGSVKTKLEKKLYNSPLDFAEDVRLTFNNAILYNPVGHDVHQFAEVLLAMFEEKWVAIEMQYDNLHRKFKPTRDIEFSAPVSNVVPTVVEPLPAPTPSPSPPPPPPPAPVLDNRNWERDESMTIPVEPETVTTAPEKPEEEEEEAPANNNRDLTLEEKRRLSEELQDLPFDKLEIVVQIIKKSNPELSQQDDEIELDIDSLDINTLWELYRFVTGYNDSLRKKKEQHQGFGSERDAESVHNIIHEEPTTLVTGTETSRVTESGKAIRTSSPARHNASGSSSSNSSSSDSGSGSSDSDSDSSSGRESDTGN